MLAADHETCLEGPSSAPIALVDSRAFYSVAGVDWVRRRPILLDGTWVTCISPSTKSYRLGDVQCFRGTGSVIINSTLAAVNRRGIPPDLRIDIAECEIPLLISRKSLVSISTVIDFAKRQISIRTHEAEETARKTITNVAICPSN